VCIKYPLVHGSCKVVWANSFGEIKVYYIFNPYKYNSSFSLNTFMMQRKIYVFCLVLSMISFVPRSMAQKGKSEIAIGYGYGSVYTLINGSPYTYSSGTPAITYRYYLSGNVTVGLGVGVETINNWGNFTTIAPEVSVAYMDSWAEKVRVKLYGSLSYGVTIFQNNSLRTDEKDNSGVWAYGFQATPIGVRVGRQVAAFLEVGMGYKGLVHGGLAVRFPRKAARHQLER